MKTRTGYMFKRGGIWQVQWRVAGTLHQQSTGETNKNAAETRREEILAPFLKGDEVRVLETVKARLEGAKGELAVMDEQRNPPLAIADTWPAYMATPNRPDTGPDTLTVYASQWKQFQRWLNENHAGMKYLREIGPDVGESYASALLKRGVSGNTYNKHVRLLELVFRVLKDKARLTVNPWERIQRKKAIAQGRRELTLAELKTVCQSAAGDLRTLFGIGIYTGLRLGDCATLRWDEVDIHGGRPLIRRIPNKTARRRSDPVLVPVHPVLLAMLEETPEKDRGEYVLPRIASDYRRHHSYVTDRVQKHFEACGIKTKSDRKQGRVQAAVLVGFHSLRHTFVSLCRESNAPLSVVEAIVGHSNPAMTRHYSHTSEAAATSAVGCLPSVYGDTKALRPALPPVDPLAAFKAEVKVLAEGMTAKTWRKVQGELLAIAS